jgi:hypothetical protein
MLRSYSRIGFKQNEIGAFSMRAQQRMDPRNMEKKKVMVMGMMQ